MLGSRSRRSAADACPRARARQVIKLMQSFKSKEFVKEAFAWRHYYWRAPRGCARRSRCLPNPPRHADAPDRGAGT